MAARSDPADGKKSAFGNERRKALRQSCERGFFVKAIYDRDLEIENFKPEIYYALVSKAKTNGEVIELTSKYKFSAAEKAKAERCCERMNVLEAVVTDKKSKKEILFPGKLYSLTKLQNFLGKKYKMPMEQSLKILQKLYEQGYVTYPRTNSEYLATAEKQKIKDIIAGVGKLGYPLVFKDGKNIFDDSKIESHSALTPTYKIPDPKTLSDDEKKVYATIVRRFVAVFCSEECIAEKTEITVKVGDYEEFNLKGTVILQKGWTKYDDWSQKNKILPPLKKGDVLLHGHTHVPAWEPFGEGNLYLNPGSVSIPKNGSARSYMTLENITFTWKTLPGEAYHTLTI